MENDNKSGEEALKEFSSSNELQPSRKYYVVWKGFQPGIYFTWAEAEKQVKGFSGARHKSFYTLEEAEEAFNNPNNK